MLSTLEWLALEAKYLDRAIRFYRERLDLRILERSDGEAALAAGGTELRLRAPGPVPRGGLHTHFAFATPPEEYGGWWERLSAEFDLAEHEFGSSRSLYLYDPDGNCVEIGQRDGDGDGEGIVGIFEIVFEVEDLDRAEEFYTRFDADIVGRGEERRRLRLDLGPVDLELWEPQLGLADARGGVHVDVGFTADDPDAVAGRVADPSAAVTDVEDGVRIRDPDGHYLTVRGG